MVLIGVQRLFYGEAESLSDMHKTGLLVSIKVWLKAKTTASYLGACSLMGKAVSAVMVLRHGCRFNPYRSCFGF